MIGYCSLYEYDKMIFKSYNGDIRKAILMRSVRKKGYQEISKTKVQKGTVNTEKLDNNISRARAVIHELALCNQWDYFVTLTLSKEKSDRYNMEQFNRRMNTHIKLHNRKYGTSVKYLLIPEQHEDGAWHMHGLVRGISSHDITINEHGYLDWISYAEKFGYCSMEKVRNHEAVSKYITKYVTKDMRKRIKELNAHLYYSSKGLQRAKIEMTGTLSKEPPVTPSYENDYCKVWDIKSAETLSLLYDCIITEDKQKLNICKTGGKHEKQNKIRQIGISLYQRNGSIGRNTENIRKALSKCSEYGFRIRRTRHLLFS